MKKNLYPFNDPQNKKHARSILNNISNWIYKLERKENVNNDEITNFLETLKGSQNILRSLYRIEKVNLFKKFILKYFRKKKAKDSSKAIRRIISMTLIIFFLKRIMKLSFKGTHGTENLLQKKIL